MEGRDELQETTYLKMLQWLAEQCPHSSYLETPLQRPVFSSPFLTNLGSCTE